MGLIKEPLDVDFIVDPRPLTTAEEKLSAISFVQTKKSVNSKNSGKKRVQNEK